MIQIIGLNRIPLVKVGDSIGDYVVRAAQEQGLQIVDGDVVVVAQKIVSKAEGRVVQLKDVTPSALAEAVARASGKDPRHVETILREAESIVKMKAGHLIVETAWLRMRKCWRGPIERGREKHGGPTPEGSGQVSGRSGRKSWS